MAALNFNMLGFSYQQGVRNLETGFEASAAALAERRTQAQLDLAAYASMVAGGGERIGEWEDGHRLWEQDQVLEMEIEDAAESIMDLRKAYALAVYHHWERAARRWTGLNGWSNHQKLATASRDLGYPIDEHLQRVRDLVNTLKHNSAERASELFASWPEVLNVDPGRHPNLDWYTLVSLEDRHVKEVFAIACRSGPTAELLPLRTGPGPEAPSRTGAS